MSGMLPSYFRRRVVVQILALLAVLTALLQMLELLDMTTEVLKREQGLHGLLYYAALRTPAEVVLMLPLAVLLGTMTAMHSMARNLEITAVRCAGVSLMRVFAYLLSLLCLGLRTRVVRRLLLVVLGLILRRPLLVLPVRDASRHGRGGAGYDRGSRCHPQ